MGLGWSACTSPSALTRIVLLASVLASVVVRDCARRMARIAEGELRRLSRRGRPAAVANELRRMMGAELWVASGVVVLAEQMEDPALGFQTSSPRALISGTRSGSPSSQSNGSLPARPTPHRSLLVLVDSQDLAESRG
jgi:hypothetical protein